MRRQIAVRGRVHDRRCSVLGGCGYDDTPVPEKPGRARLHPGRGVGLHHRSTDPGVLRARLTAPSRRAARSTGSARTASSIVGVSADTYLMGSRNPADQPDRGLRHRVRQGDRRGDLRTSGLQPSTRPPVPGDHRSRPDPVARRPDAEQRAATSSFATSRSTATAGRRSPSRPVYYTRDPEGAGRVREATGEGRTRARGPGGPAGLRAHGSTSLVNIERRSRKRDRAGHQPHGLPDQVPARRGRRDHRRRHGAGRSRRPGPLRRRARAGLRSNRRALRHRRSTRTTIDLVRFVNCVLEQMIEDQRLAACLQRLAQAAARRCRARQPRRSARTRGR